ncbi:MAG: hypothetical protein LQ347_003167 [Umbilicaria vellea]|nr:MAG: hypothetical protein LQ347_003167 [Umbilicaria vellea]
MDEITLSISIFDRPAHNFASFLDAIDQEKFRDLIPMYSNITFDSALRYLGFADLTGIEDETVHAAFLTHFVLQERNVKYLRWQDDPAQETHTSRTIRRDYATKVLDWLYKTKEVGNIYHLYAPDPHDNPHSEEVIEKAIKSFRIEVLDWRRVYLSIDSIVDGAPTIRELYLYSSGNKAALSHCFGIQGLDNLPGSDWPTREQITAGLFDYSKGVVDPGVSAGIAAARTRWLRSAHLHIFYDQSK